MSFFRVNGWAIPMADGTPAEAHEIGGDFARTITGSRFSDEMYNKRVWKGSTPPLTEMITAAIKGAVRGLGHAWNFDSDLYSSKGIAASGSTTAVRRQAAPADGSANATNHNGDGESKFGAYALGNSQAVTNDMSAAGAGCQDHTEWTAIDSATKSDDTTHYFQQTQSIKVVTNAAVNAAKGGILYAPVGVWPGAIVSDTAVVMAIVKCTTAASIRLALSDGAGEIAFSETTLPAADVWTVIRVNAATINDAGALSVSIIETVADSNLTFYVGAVMVERVSGAGSYPSSTWVAGGSTSPASDLEYAAALVNQSVDCTINLWALAYHSPAAAKECLIRCVSSTAASSFGIEYNASLKLQGLVDTTALGAVSNPYVWAMVTLVVRTNKETGEANYEFYLDGVSQGTLTATPDTSLITNIYVGHNAGTQYYRGIIDDLQILPYAAPVAQVLAWHDMAKAVPALSKYYVDGDAMPDTALTVLAEGDARASSYVAGHREGEFKSNLRRVEFEAWEV